MPRPEEPPTEGQEVIIYGAWGRKYGYWSKRVWFEARDDSIGKDIEIAGVTSWEYITRQNSEKR